MNINKLIIEVLNQFGYPVRHKKYSGSEKTYITFFEVNNYDEDYSDEEAETEVHSLQIDLWSKNDLTEIKGKIKSALKEKFSEVTYTEVEDPDINHIAFRCYYYENLL